MAMKTSILYSYAIILLLFSNYISFCNYNTFPTNQKQYIVISNINVFQFQVFCVYTYNCIGYVHNVNKSFFFKKNMSSHQFCFFLQPK